MAQWFDLRPDKNLLDFNFDGYKLSLAALAQYKCELSGSNAADIAKTADKDFFVYQHLRLFNFFNNLFENPFDSRNTGTKCVFYFNKQLALIRAEFNSQTRRGDLCTETGFQLDLDAIDFEHRYANVSLKFLSESSVIICDGFETLYFCEIDSNKRWKTAFRHSLRNDKTTHAVIRDATFNPVEKTVNLLLLNIVENDSNKFETMLNWYKFYVSQSPVVKFLKKFTCGITVPEYASVERGSASSSIVIIGSSSIKLKFDSEAPGVIFGQEEKKAVEAVSDEMECEKIVKWSQNDQEVLVFVDLKHEGLQKADLTKVEMREKDVEVHFRDSEYLKGLLGGLVKPAESFWQIDSAKGQLELTLAKRDFGVWTRLFSDSAENYCEYIMPSDFQAEMSTIQVDPAKIAASKQMFNLSEQLEECDGVINEEIREEMPLERQPFEEDYLILQRFDATTRQITHKTYVNNNKYLFEVALDAQKMAAFCLRHDVDGILWQPNEIGEPWLRHEHTFLAFGYVEASKTNAKYRAAPPDCSYSLVCDTNKHIYVYRQNGHRVDSALRNRKSGKAVTHVSKQHLITLESEAEIRGLCAFNDYLVVLMECELVFIQINVKEE